MLGFNVFVSFLCCHLLLYWSFNFLFLSCVPLHLPYEGKCQNIGRPDMTDQRWHPEMMDWRRHAWR